MTGSFDVQTWSPVQLGVVDDAYLERLATLYRADGVLHGRFEAALQQQDTVGEEPMAGRGARRGGIAPLMRATTRILRQDDAPNIAAVEFSGGHPCEPGTRGRRARPPPRPACRRSDGTAHRNGDRLGKDHRCRHDGVRTHSAAERYRRN